MDRQKDRERQTDRNTRIDRDTHIHTQKKTKREGGGSN